MGEWLNGSTNFADVSGYTPAGTHDSYIVGNGNCVFTNDVPPGKSGRSLFFYNDDTGLAISNSSTLDANYTNTFDDQINNAFTVSCWARGFPLAWSPWVSKWGDFVTYPEYSTTSGWQLRQYGSSGYACFTVRDNNAGGLVFGNASFDLDDLASTYPSNDGGWHFYAGTFNANTGVRDLYVDGMLAAQETNNVAYQLAPFSHLVIGGKDSAPGNNFGFFSTFEIYDVRVFNFAPPITGGIPVGWRVIPGTNGGNLVLTWPWGTLLQATNLAGPWSPTLFARPDTNIIWPPIYVTSPCTNSMMAPQMFFKVSQSMASATLIRSQLPRLPYVTLLPEKRHSFGDFLN